MADPVSWKLRRDELAAIHAVLVVEALMLSGRNMPSLNRSAPADQARLRGIPVIGRNCGGGAIPGTVPGARLMC